MACVKVAEIGEIASHTSKAVDIQGKRVALFNVNGDFFALDDACPHRGGPLSEGTLNGDWVACPWHAAKFNIKTGETGGPPSPKGVTPYPVTVDPSGVYIEIP